MSLTHCPLCVGLALLSIGRAVAHLTLLALMARSAVAEQAAVGLKEQPIGVVVAGA